MVRRERRRAAPCAATLLIAALGVAALGIAGCGSSSSSQTGPATTATTTATTSTSTSTSTSVTTSGTTSTQTAAASGATSAATANTSRVAACLTRNLRLSLSSSGGAAGTAFFVYQLTNAGPASCSLIGYPGVSVLDARGHIVQHPAKRGAVTAALVRLVILRPGRGAKFLVSSTDVIPSPGCPRAYTGTTLQVYPPNQRAAILLPRTGSFCNLRVGPIQRAG